MYQENNDPKKISVFFFICFRQNFCYNLSVNNILKLAFSVVVFFLFVCLFWRVYCLLLQEL